MEKMGGERRKGGGREERKKERGRTNLKMGIFREVKNVVFDCITFL